MTSKKTLKAKIETLEQDVKTLNSLRPAWAQGYTSDSSAAQASSNAMLEMWEELGVSNQTDAMVKLRKVMAEHKEPKP